MALSRALVSRSLLLPKISDRFWGFSDSRIILSWEMLKFGRNPIFEVLPESLTADFIGGFFVFGPISDTQTWVLWVLE